MRPTRGVTLPETLAVLVVVALLAGTALPELAAMRAAALTAAGARHVAITLQALRWKSVMRGRGHGLRFTQDERGWAWYEVADGDGDGVRTADIESGVDPTLSGPHRLEHVASGITFGFPRAGPIASVPPGAGWIEDLDDPIRIGKSSVLAFGPLGTATSGTLFVTDGRRRLHAVVIYGPTGKVRTMRYATENGRWTS